MIINNMIEKILKEAYWIKKASKYDELLKFDGSDKDIQLLKEFLSELNLKSGKSPRGMTKLYGELKFLEKQLSIGAEYGTPMIGTSNIKAVLSRWTKEDLDTILEKMSSNKEEPIEIKLAHATFFNHSIISYKNFVKIANEIDKLLGTLKGFHAKALKPELKIYFVKKEDSKAKATYKSEKDVIYVRPDKATSGDEYASFNYIIVHELGHRYLKLFGVKFDYDRSDWITTPYSKTDSMTGEEKFAELFALSHFNYSRFPEYKEKIEKFNKEMNS